MPITSGSAAAYSLWRDSFNKEEVLTRSEYVGDPPDGVKEGYASVSMNKIGVDNKQKDVFMQVIVVKNILAYNKLVKDYKAKEKGRTSIFETYEQLRGSIIAMMVDRVDKTFKNRLL